MRRFADPPGGASPPPLQPPGEYRALGPNLGMDFCSAVLSRLAGAGGHDGLRPGPKAPVWPMDAFRDRFLSAFGSQPAPG